MVWRPFYFANLIVDPTNPERLFKPDGSLIQSLDGGKSFRRRRRRRARRLPRGLDRSERIPRTSSSATTAACASSRTAATSGGRATICRCRSSITSASITPIRSTSMAACRTTPRWVGDSAYPGGISNRAMGKHVRLATASGCFPIRPTNYIYAETQGGAIGRINRYTHEIRNIQPIAALQREAALELEYADRAVAERERHDLHRCAVPVPFARPWTELGAHLAGPDHERSGKAEAGAVRRHHRRQFGRRGLHDDLLDQRIAKAARLIWVGTDDGNLQVTRDGGKRLGQRRRQHQGPAEAIVGQLGAGEQLRRRHAPMPRSTAHSFGDMTPYVYRTDRLRQDLDALVAPRKQGRAWLRAVIKQDTVKPDLLYRRHRVRPVDLDRRRRPVGAVQGRRFPGRGRARHGVQPRDADRLATHGRGIWIIDDITPLRALTPKAARAEAAFVPGRPHTQRIARAGRLGGRRRELLGQESAERRG